MDVRQLRYFVRVIELKSFSRAAEVLHVAQPALGLQIRKLEDELHTQLLTRHSRGVEPTEAGNLLRQRAEAILQAVEETKAEIRDFSGPARGVARIATTPATHPFIPIELIRRSAVELPNIQIAIQEAVSATLLDWVREEKIDFAIGYFAGPRAEDVLIEDLAEETAVFIQRYEDGLPATISFAELCQHPLVMPAPPHHLRALIQTIAGREGLAMDFSYEIGAIGTILSMVEEDIACSVVPRGAIARHMRNKRIAARAIVAPELKLTISLVRSPRRALSKAQIMLRSLLTQIAAEATSGQA